MWQASRRSPLIGSDVTTKTFGSSRCGRDTLPSGKKDITELVVLEDYEAGNEGALRLAFAEVLFCGTGRKADLKVAATKARLVRKQAVDVDLAEDGTAAVGVVAAAGADVDLAVGDSGQGELDGVAGLVSAGGGL